MWNHIVNTNHIISIIFPNEAGEAIRPGDASQYGSVPLLFRRRVQTASKVLQYQNNTLFVVFTKISLGNLNQLCRGKLT